jgi:hypothetical protein
MIHAEKFPVGMSRETSALPRASLTLYNDPYVLPNKLPSAFIFGTVLILKCFPRRMNFYLHCSTNVSIGLGAMIELQFFKIHSMNLGGIPPF